MTASRSGALALLFVPALAAVLLGQPPEPAPPPRTLPDRTRPPEPEPEPPEPTADPCAPTRIDRDRLHFRYVRDDAPLQHQGQNQQEFDAYNEIILHAHRLDTATLERCANRDVTFLDLVKAVRQDYQFTLVYLEGRLRRVRRMEPARPLRDAGLTDLYEAWVFPPDRADPFCVVFTQLPTGLGPSRDYDPTRRVGVAGYSFKLMHYESAEPDPDRTDRRIVRRAPLLIAHSLTLFPEPTTDGGESWRTGFFPGMLVGVALIGGVVFGLTWWFRRGDRRIRRELDARHGHNPFEETTRE